MNGGQIFTSYLYFLDKKIKKYIGQENTLNSRFVLDKRPYTHKLCVMIFYIMMIT